MGCRNTPAGEEYPRDNRAHRVWLRFSKRFIIKQYFPSTEGFDLCPIGKAAIWVLSNTVEPTASQARQVHKH